MHEAKIEYPDSGIDWSKTESTFFKVWKGTPNKPSKFKYLVIRKNPPIGKCTECVDSFTALLASKTKEELQAVRQRRAIHFGHVREERAIYSSHMKLAREHPRDYASLAVDGMDQAKTAVPFANGKRDRTNSCATTQARVIAVVIHNVGTCCYVAPADIPHTVDTTITVLMDAFQFLPKTADGRLAPKLFIQMDNTNADNKTHVFFAWAASLVETKLFKQIEASFLPVGHTHADVDQKFSNISKYLWANPVHTFAELAKACKKALPNDCIHACVLKRNWIVNFKRFYDDQHAFNKDTFCGSRDVHGFLFDIQLLDEEGGVCLQTKEWTRMEHWIPSQTPLRLQLPETLYFVPAVSLFKITELDKIIQGLESFLKFPLDGQVGDESSGDEPYDSDTSDAGDWTDGEGGRRPFIRQPTERTLRSWKKMRAHQLALQGEDCELCIKFASVQRDIIISSRQESEARNLARRQKQSAAEKLAAHVTSTDCTRDLELKEDVVGSETWDFYITLLRYRREEPVRTVNTLPYLRTIIYCVVFKLVSITCSVFKYTTKFPESFR